MVRPNNWSAEVLSEAKTHLLAQWHWFAIGAAVALAFIILDRVARQSRIRGVLHFTTLFGATSAGLWMSLNKAWLGDDAFITFRYAQNFARGEGFVFNKGEWVEGYTNFLWTFILGVGAKLGADIPMFALSGNLLSFALVIFLCTAIVKRASSNQSPTVPFSAIALAVGYTMTTWATSGLETMPGAFAVLLGAYFMLGENRLAATLASVSFAAASLMRPDHVLFFAAAGLAFVVDDLVHLREFRLRHKLGSYLAFIVPFVLLYGGHYLWRWSAYGDLFPNTYYAKSGGSSYWAQGVVYLVLFLVTSGAWAWAFLPALFGKWRGLPRPVQRYGLLALFGTIAFSLYVVKVGGDFMLNRFFVSVLPLMATAIEIGLRARLAGKTLRSPLPWLVSPLLAFGLASAVVPMQLIGPLEKKWHVAAEETFYKLKSFRPLDIDSTFPERGKRLARLFASRGLYPRFAEGCVGMIAYYSDLPLVDRFGLTNKRIARKPISVRGRPGHEKYGDLTDLLEENAIFSEALEWPGRVAETRFILDGATYYLVQWDDELMLRLATIPGAQVPNLNGLVDEAAAATDPGVLSDHIRFYEYFLRRSPLRDPVLARLKKVLGTMERPSNAAQVVTFDSATWPAEVRVTGTAFGSGPATAALSGQTYVSGFLGSSFVNSFHGGDASVGRMEIALRGSGKLKLLVGGGSDCDRVFAAVQVDGKLISRVCGKNQEVLRAEVLEVPEGRAPSLVIVDESVDAWGHILVDHLVLVQPEVAAPALP